MEEGTGAHRTSRAERMDVRRVWHGGKTPAQQWRASLQEGPHGEQRHFVSLDDGIKHLHAA